jgi:GntR family transcriptional regulator/MocR family aminotransferase
VFLELDGRGPRHGQLTRALKSAILGGRVPAGARLPATRELAVELGLSRTTVLAAYEQLHAEGFIDSRTGSGSFVAPLRSTTDAVAPTPPTSVPAPSAYAARMREGIDWLVGRRNDGLRYNLQYSEPLIQPALCSQWSRELTRAAAYTETDYPRTQGLLPLREQLCDYLARRRGVVATPEDVIIVNGSQQAYALCARVLVDEGARVILEDPHYFSAFQIMRTHGASIVGVPADENGLVCEELPDCSPALICVTPSHQFPAASRLSLARRLALLRYAHEHRSWILEDDYDGEFHYDAQPLAALRALDHMDRVIYVGTFSKVLFPSLRMGYMVVPKALRDDFVMAKWLSDLGSPSIEQAALANFIADGGFERYLRQAARSLKERREALIEGMRKHVGDRIELFGAPAGMHIIGWLRDLDDARTEALVDLAHSRGLGLHTLAPFYLHPPPRPGLLLGYAGLPPAELHEAARLLGECLDEIDRA